MLMAAAEVVPRANTGTDTERRPKGGFFVLDGVAPVRDVGKALQSSSSEAAAFGPPATEKS